VLTEDSFAGLIDKPSGRFYFSGVTARSPATRRPGAAAGAPATPKGEASRAFILQAAAEVFASKGYAHTTFGDLIAASGMTKGAFYFYFQSKEALACAVLERKQQEWLSCVSGQVLSSDDPVSQLRGLADAMLELHRADPSVWSISKLTKELAHLPGVGAEASRPMSQWVDFVAGLIRTAQAAGRARGDVDALDLAVVLVGGFDGLKGLLDVLDGEAAQARFEAGVRMLARMVEATLAL